MYIADGISILLTGFQDCRHNIRKITPAMFMNYTSTKLAHHSLLHPCLREITKHADIKNTRKQFVAFNRKVDKKSGDVKN